MARSDEDISPRSKAVLVPVLLLLLTAVIANIYLTNLYYAVRAAGSAESVASFCNVSQKVNCVTVAASEYSSFLGVPIAIYALEFFALAAGLTLLSVFGLWRVRTWDGLVFLMMIIGLPISALMAWLSICRIDSLCLLCTVVYGVNIVVLLIIGLSRRRKLGAAIGASLSELKKQLSASGKAKLLLVLIVGFGLSQLLWVPKIGPAPRKSAPSLGSENNPWEKLPRQGLTVGRPDAPVKIEVFTDFQCPFCAQLHHMLHQVILNNPEVQLTHRDFPLDQACNRKITRLFHQHACSAALHARCAAEQGKFWHYSSYLYGNQSQLSKDNLEMYAKKVGLDLAKLRGCLTNKASKQAIVQDIEEAISRKVSGTPSCFLNGKQIKGRKIIDPAFWQQLIDEALGKKPRPSP